VERERAEEIAKKIKRLIVRDMKKYGGGIDYSLLQDEIIKILENEL
jgi:hypothetical protein